MAHLNFIRPMIRRTYQGLVADDDEAVRESLRKLPHGEGYQVIAVANGAEAQEVVQETMIGLARKIGDFKTGSIQGSFKAWLLKQAQWRIGDQFRKRSKAGSAQATTHAAGLEGTTGDEIGLTATIDRIPDPATLPLETLSDEEWRDQLRRTALERVKLKVSVRQYQMFDRHVLQNVSVEEAVRVTEPPRLIPQAAGGFQIECWINQSFEVETSTDLENWSSGETVTNETGDLAFQDPQPAQDTCRYYRVKVKP